MPLRVDTLSAPHSGIWSDFESGAALLCLLHGTSCICVDICVYSGMYVCICMLVCMYIYVCMLQSVTHFYICSSCCTHVHTHARAVACAPAELRPALLDVYSQPLLAEEKEQNVTRALAALQALGVRVVLTPAEYCAQMAETDMVMLMLMDLWSVLSRTWCDACVWICVCVWIYVFVW